MALSNHDRVGAALALLRDSLRPFIAREVKAHGGRWPQLAEDVLADTRLGRGQADPANDVAALLVVMDRTWNDFFRHALGKTERSIVNELLEVRNRWAHQEAFSTDQTYRALDSAGLLLNAISAPQAADLERMKAELLRLRYDEQVRGERRRAAGTAVEGAASVNLKPWREVVTPHHDVASGRYQQAEFAADLWQVYLGEGADEYRNPVEFFRRTYLTDSLKGLLVGAARRLTGQAGDPVVQLQTNFGGGKTHSMLALYHLFSGASARDLPGVEAVLQEAEVKALPIARPVVLVGTKISPGDPVAKPDGCVVRTLWGELAWQLGGKEAFARVANDDERATNPGDKLRELFNDYGPCLILIDEWVAYARQLHDQSDLPAGGFETQFTFAQALTESAKAARGCLVVISLPASDTAVSPHEQADDLEVGGQRGREALDRLRNVIGRSESSWRPASAEESFEIVRRRLFEPLADPAQFKDRDVVARAFAECYRSQQQEFPPACRDAGYETRIKAAYPIHPEIFDRLYTDWSALVRFQRTRGVLRLMAAVIHSLWEKGDRNPLILPANIPIDDHQVQSELTRYLPDNWAPVIEKDVDGPASLPLRLDGELPNLGKFSACRRVARAIYLGSAPTTATAHRGLEDRQVKLGCVMPGESPPVFGDALRRLAGAATYLYQDGTRYWYSTQPTVTKLAEDRAEQLKRDTDKVTREIDQRLRADLRAKGEFARVHPMPRSPHEVPDDPDVGLVVLATETPYSREPGSLGQAAALNILESRGAGPRLCRNALVFLAADKTRLQDLDEAARRYLAWESILDEKVLLNLDPQQVKQAETQRASADAAVTARLPETYQWLLVPKQANPQAPLDWEAIRLAGQDPLAVRAGKKLVSEELVFTGMAGTRLKHDLDRVPLWRGDRVALRQLADDFAQYVYLPRLKTTQVLLDAIADGVRRLTWDPETFAYADSYDEARGRYVGLKAGEVIRPLLDSQAVILRSEAARKQLEEDAQASAGFGAFSLGASIDHAIPSAAVGDGRAPYKASAGDAPSVARKLRRFHGTVSLRPKFVTSDAGNIADEVLQHLTSLLGADVEVTLEIHARVPDGVPDNVVRIVTENAATLKFSSQGFEED